MADSPKMFIYGSMLIGVIGFLFSFIFGSSGAVLGGFFSGLGAVMAMVFWKYGYIIIPVITQRARIVTIDGGGFEVPPSNDVIVKKSGSVYYASVFLGIKIYESATEKSSEENFTYNQYFERAISNLKYVVKIAYMMYVEDIGEKRKLIETKRAEAQLRLARERDKPEPDVLRIDKYEREVTLWDTQLNKLIKGLKPMGVIAYAMTTAAGVSKDAAVASVKAQANELKTVLANSLNVEVKWLTADEMLKCFEWETFFPTSVHELEESVM